MQLAARLVEISLYLKKKFDMLIDHPLVNMAESCGLVAGLNLVKKKGATIHDGVAFDSTWRAGMLCCDYMVANGVIMHAVGDRMLIHYS